MAATYVKVLLVVSSQVGGRVLTEAATPNRQALDEFLEAHYVNCEWKMRTALDAQPDGITEY